MFALSEVFKSETFLLLRNQSVTRLHLCIFRSGTNNLQINNQFSSNMQTLWNNQSTN